MDMHDVSRYGGKRVPNTRSGIKISLTVQFPTKGKMEHWLKHMRTHYPSHDDFCPFINRDKNVVVY